MKISVNRNRCSGIGLCEMTAPAVFEVGDDGQSHVIDESPADEQRAAVQEAVKACPTGALTMDE